MSKYRKKPVVIEAFQWKGEFKAHAFPRWFLQATERGEAGKDWIQTLEGKMKFSAGDWIIQGIKGELYPCKPDIFGATYESTSSRPVWKEVIDEVADGLERTCELAICDAIETRIKERLGLCERPDCMGETAILLTDGFRRAKLCALHEARTGG